MVWSVSGFCCHLRRMWPYLGNGHCRPAETSNPEDFMSQKNAPAPKRPSPRPPNGPSTTGNRSGKGRGNLPPRGKR